MNNVCSQKYIIFCMGMHDICPANFLKNCGMQLLSMHTALKLNLTSWACSGSSGRPIRKLWLDLQGLGTPPRIIKHKPVQWLRVKIQQHLAWGNFMLQDKPHYSCYHFLVRLAQQAGHSMIHQANIPKSPCLCIFLPTTYLNTSQIYLILDC